MLLTIEEVRRIATLARLRLTPAEEVKFASQLSRVVDYIDQLKGFEAGDADRQESRAVEAAADSVADCLPLAAFQRNAPETSGPYLVVPKVKADDE